MPETIKIVKPTLPDGTILKNIIGERIRYTDIHGSERSALLQLAPDILQHKPWTSNGIPPSGNWIVDSDMLETMVKTCGEVWVMLLNIGSMRLNREQVLYNIKKHSKIHGIRITFLDGDVIINNPEHIG